MLCLVSNAQNLEAALDARFDSGPLNNVWSTPVIMMEHQSPKRALETLEKKFSMHPVFQCREYSLYYWEGNETSL